MTASPAQRQARHREINRRPKACPVTCGYRHAVTACHGTSQGCDNGATTEDGPGGAANTVLPALTPDSTDKHPRELT